MLFSSQICTALQIIDLCNIELKNKSYGKEGKN